MEHLFASWYNLKENTFSSIWLKVGKGIKAVLHQRAFNPSKPIMPQDEVKNIRFLPPIDPGEVLKMVLGHGMRVFSIAVTCLVNFGKLLFHYIAEKMTLQDKTKVDDILTQSMAQGKQSCLYRRLGRFPTTQDTHLLPNNAITNVPE